MAVGDSLTAGVSGVAADGEVSSPSWLPAAVAEGTPSLVGVWARPGATANDLLTGIPRWTADVVVILVGTNDTIQGVDPSLTISGVQALAEAVDAPRAVILAVPPCDLVPREADLLNVGLERLAHERGWRWLDPWDAVDTDGSYSVGASPDGIHPTEEVAAAVGRQVRAAVEAP